MIRKKRPLSHKDKTNALHEVRHRKRSRLAVLQSVRDAAQPRVSEVRSSERT